MPVLLLAQANKGLHTRAKFPIGVALNSRITKGEKKYIKVVQTEFNSITAENMMKMKALQPAEGEYYWAGADSLVAFAQANKMRLHGHCLVWHMGSPKWIEKYDGDSAKLENILRKHITAVLSRYKGKVASWDVVNEAVSDTNGQLRKGSIWYRNLGPGYIKRAFVYARGADRDAKLFYNDYSLEHDMTKLEAVIDLVKDLRKDGTPIDGIGTQMHTHSNLRAQTLQQSLRKLGNTGLLIHISELDVCINGETDKDAGVKARTPALDNAQADVYRTIAAAYKNQVPPKQQYGITMWNLHDSDTWVPKLFNKPDWPTLFDEKMQRKPAYLEFSKGL